MAPRPGRTASPRPHRKQGERLKDEVYRHMFRLEMHRAGAEMDLALALLRAWMADAADNGEKQRQWLQKICPICLTMIERTEQTHGAGKSVTL